jgi:hypothetical protein
MTGWIIAIFLLLVLHDLISIVCKNKIYKKSVTLIKIFIDVYFCGGFSNYNIISKLNIKTLEVLKV